MSDEQTDDAKPGLVSGAYRASVHDFPQEALGRWIALDDTQEVAVRWTKSDFDHLYFAIQKIAYGVSHTQGAVLHLTNERTAEAQSSFDQATDELINGVNHLIDFMGSIMEKSEAVDSGR
jgi:hypothetical protein